MLTALRDWYGSLTDIKREEWAPTGLMLAYGFLALTSYYIIKPARNSVFVDRVGADNLPYVYILTALAVTGVMYFYSRYVERIRELVLLLGTFAFLASNLLGFWLWLRVSQDFWSSGAFYIWGKLYPLLLVSQFFLVGNLIFTTRQARRLFGPIGVGLILGGIAGSTISGWAATVLGTENLLLVAAGFLFLCAAIVLALSPHMTGGEGASRRLVEKVSGDALGLLRESSHLKTIAAILGLTIVVGTMIDWQFNSAAEQFIPGEDAKTAFFGKFFLGLNIVSVLIQIFVTGFVLRKFGVGAAMLALPAGLLAASVGVLLVPLLATAVLAKGTEGALRYSLDQSTRELLYLPVATDVKYKVKPLIDLAVYRGGTGLGGVILLVLVNLLDLPWELTIRLVAIAALVCIGLWVAVTFRMRREFRGSIQRLIGARDVDLDRLIVGRLGAEALDEVRAALRRGREEEVVYALSLLERYRQPGFAEDIAGALDHDSAEVRGRAASLLREMGAESYVPRVRPLLEDPSLNVRVEAIRYLCRFEEGDAVEAMQGFLEHEDDRVRLAATACLLRHGEMKQAKLGEDAVERMAATDMPERRANAARLLGSVDSLTEREAAVLDRLVEDEAAEVRHAALHAVGEARARHLVPTLLDRLDDPEDRDAAREGLRAFGREIHRTLIDYLGDRRTARAARAEIAALLHPEADGRTVDALLELLPELEPDLRFETLKTLNKLRRDRDDLVVGEEAIEELLEREVREAYGWAARERALASSGETESLLARLLRQRRFEAVERATRALGLTHDQEVLHAIYEGCRSPNELDRQRAYELLDNDLPRRHREPFDPLLNPDRSEEEIAAAAEERYGVEPTTRTVTLRALAEGDDPWARPLARRELGMEADEEETAADEARGPALRIPHDSEDGMDIVERAELLRETELFDRLRVEDLAGIAALVEEREYAKGEVLFEEGGAGSELFIVVEGRVEARQVERTLFTADAGQTVGDLSLLDGHPRSYRAVAASDCRVFVLGREEFYDLLEERFQVVTGLVSHLARVIRRLNQAIVEDGREPAEGREADEPAEGREAGEPAEVRGADGPGSGGEAGGRDRRVGAPSGGTEGDDGGERGREGGSASRP